MRGTRSVSHMRLAEASDMSLVEMTRSGVSDAFGELWKRHAAAVQAAIRSFTGFDPDDVAQETFLRVLRQIQEGRGPNTAFRAYAIMTARNVSANMARGASGNEVTGSPDEVFEEASGEQRDTESTVLGNAFTVQVFSTLPTRWQEVLWYREVEDLPVRQICTYLGMSENATSVLLKRAREGFKQAWIAANLEPSKALSQDCTWVLERLPQFTRGKVRSGALKKMEAHFLDCARCAILAEQADYLHAKLALVLLPAFMGGAAATQYAAWLQSAGAGPAVAAVVASDPLLERATKPAAQSSSGTGPGALNKVFIPVAVLGATGALILTFAFAGSPPTEREELRSGVGDSTVEATAGMSGAGTGVNGRGSGAAESPEGAGSGAESKDAAGGSASLAGEDAGPAVDGLPAPAEPLPGAPASGFVTLAASPLDGYEVGVFPRLVGRAMPRATVTLTVTNERGETRTGVAYADAQGRWAYTPTELMGVVTVTGSQSYPAGGSVAAEAGVLIGVFQVGRGLGIEVGSIGPDQTTIRVTGLGSPTKNQVVNIESTALGMLASKYPPTAAGEVALTVPYARAALGDLRFWQGDTSEGPRRTWWRTS